MKGIRIDKYLSEMGEGSRSQIREMAKKGRIWVDGIPEPKTERKIIPGENQVSIDGRTVVYEAFEYFLLNKPQGVVSAVSDRRCQTVVELILERRRQDLFPVGRLDIDTEGLLLITNDGELAHRLLAPGKHVDKVYFAKVEGVLPPDARGRMEKGLVLPDGTELLPACLEVLGAHGNISEVRLTIWEGKFHQVKRMFETLGCQVIYLKRLSMGSLVLDEGMKPGDYRPLTEAEIKGLRGTHQRRKGENPDVKRTESSDF